MYNFDNQKNPKNPNERWYKQPTRIFYDYKYDCFTYDAKDDKGRYYEAPRYCGNERRLEDGNMHTGPSATSVEGCRDGLTIAILDGQTIFNSIDVMNTAKGPNLILINACSGEVDFEGSGDIQSNFDNIPPNHYVIFGTHGSHYYGDMELRKHKAGKRKILE